MSFTADILNNAQIINNIASTLTPVEKLLTASTYLLGAVFLYKGILSLKELGKAQMSQSHGAFKEPFLYFLVGSVLFYFPTTLHVLLDTTFGYSSPLAYSSLNTANKTGAALFGPGSPVGAALTRIIQVIGLVAFIRGWVLISKTASQGQPPGGMSKGAIHVVGGIMALNIVGTLQILNNTLYGT